MITLYSASVSRFKSNDVTAEATENAKNIINGLTLDYNKARQTQITNELLEITTAMRAME